MRSAAQERIEELEAKYAPPAQDFFDVTAHCFPKQLPFVSSKAKFRLACCGRRAGKSEADAALLVDTALAKPGSVGLYLTTSRVNAKRIIWRPLKKLLRDRGIAAEPNESDLSVTFSNGSVVYLAGCTHRDELEKYRGLPLAIVVIDEAQLLSGYLEPLLDEILVPALMDYDGSIALTGTPAPTPAGYFWECFAGKYTKAWEQHSWTPFDNPYIKAKSGKTPQQHMEAELQRRGVTQDDPKIQREWFARWAFDPSSLVFKYDATKCDYESLPRANEWSRILSVDLGWDDADAIAVLEWHEHSPDLYLTEEHVLPKQTITQLGDKLKAMDAKYQPLKIVMDMGGLGKKIAEEMRARWGLNVVAAEKERKLEHIELLNDAMTSGHLKARKDSRFAQDCVLVEWDKSNPEKWAISDRFHSDICDAVLYGHRHAKQWLATPPPKELPPRNTVAYAEAMAARVQREVDAQMERDLEEQTAAYRQKQEERDDEADFLW